MLAKRVIACLDVRAGTVVKGVSFENLTELGDPVQLARAYCRQGADEIVLLDVCATNASSGLDLALVKRLGAAVDVPLTVGGGVRSLEDMRSLFRAGADKVAINSAALWDPRLLGRAARVFGTQAVVVAIDVKSIGTSWQVRTHSAQQATTQSAVAWAIRATELGAGEVLLTSIDADGRSGGFDIALTHAVASAVETPVIASGGAACADSFLAVFTQTAAGGALAAGAFHRRELTIGAVKQHLSSAGVCVRS